MSHGFGALREMWLDVVADGATATRGWKTLAMAHWHQYSAQAGAHVAWSTSRPSRTVGFSTPILEASAHTQPL